MGNFERGEKEGSVARSANILKLRNPDNFPRKLFGCEVLFLLFSF